MATVVPWMTSSISAPENADTRQGRLEALGNAAAEIVRRRRNLDGQRPPRLSQQDEIGERPSDVDAYAKTQSRPPDSFDGNLIAAASRFATCRQSEASRCGPTGERE